MDIESKDLVKIIEACGKVGVSRFKCTDIEIEFNGFVKFDEKDYPSKVESVLENVNVDPNFMNQQEYEIASDAIEDLLVTDPVAYEETLFKDELEPSETHMDEE